MLPFPINLPLPWLTAFLIAACGLVAACAVWIFSEWGEPEWKRYQQVSLEEMRENLERELPILEDSKWGDPSKAKIVRASIEFLRKPDYQIKQIILKGQGSWKKGTSGTPVDRCMTCHIDEDKLDKQHPYTKNYFAFSVYGCTVCHEGQGRVLRSKEEAHSGMFRNRRDMMARIKKPEEMLALWTRMAELSVQDGLTAFDFRDYNAAGEKLVYVGSFGCLKCHRKLNPRHVEVWANKSKTWEHVVNARDYVEGDENYRKKCLACHTTGDDERTGEYAEEDVTGEGCHGPGEMFARFMSEGKLAEAAIVTHDVFSYKVCGRCHVPHRHAMREAMLVATREEEDEREFLEWLASSFGEESGDLYAGISEETEAHGLEELRRLEEVGNSLDRMLEDIWELLPEQERAVQSAEGVAPDDEERPHPLRVRLEAPEPLNVNEQEVRAETPEELFIGKGAS